MGVISGGDAVHVHASMVGDLYKLVPWMEENFQKAFKAVDCFRKRSKLSAAFKLFQLEEGLHPYVLVKARFERLGSKFGQTRRLLKVKKVIRKFVHKKRFKAAFGGKKKDRDKRIETADVLKSRDFWKKQKLAAKVLSPIMRSMRLSDTRLQGKAGLLLPQLRRVQTSVAARLQKACETVMPGEPLATAQAVRAVKDKIEERILELASDGVKAACRVHPHNLKELREEEDQKAVCTK